MKNILEILKGIGVEIPEDKKEEFNTSFTANYKTINEVSAINTKLSTLQTKYDTDIASRDTDLANLKSQLEDAGTDKTKLDDVTKKLTTLQSEYDTAKADWEQKLSSQQYEFLVREKANSLKFTSNSAKKAFLADALEKGIAVQDGELVGFDKYLETYKETDADAFVTEEPPKAEPPKKVPTFVQKTTPKPEPQSSHPDVPTVW